MTEHYPTVWVYKRTDGVFTVGYYDPEGKWHTDSDHSDRESAAARVNYLNGGKAPSPSVIEAARRGYYGKEQV